MQQFDECKLRELAEKFSAWQASVERRKKRGINDFNPLLCVQKAHDEKDMHSGFLYALLNPRGEHCQDELFLELFLESIGLQNFFGRCKNASVSKEKKNIDIHIFNGEKHIIIENKIWSGDQEGQIARYIESVAKDLGVDSALESSPESSEIQSAIYDNIAVVYLAPFTRQPEAHSLNDWQIQGEFLQSSKGFKVAYRQISYEAQILHWLEKCKEEIGNIANLKMAIECYEDVVKRITGKKENTMDVAAFFKKDKNSELFSSVLDIIKKQDEILEAYAEHMYDAIKNRIESQYNTEGYKCAKDYGIEIWHKDFDTTALVLAIYAAQSDDGKKMEISVSLSGGDYLEESKAYKDNLIKALFEVIGTYEVDESYKKKSYYICPQIGGIKEKELVDFSVDDFFTHFDSIKDKVNELNRKIKADLDKGADSKLAKFAESRFL